MSVLQVLTIAQCWQPIVSYCSRHDLHLKHLIFQYYYVNALFQLKNYFKVVQLGSAVSFMFSMIVFEPITILI